MRIRPTVIVLIGSLLLVSTMAVVVGASEAEQPPPAIPSCDASTSGTDCLDDQGVASWWQSPRAIDAHTSERGIRPERIIIPKISVDSEVVPVGIAKDDSLEIPQDIDVIGWYRFGPTPAWGSGSTVLVGHRDSLTQGHGAFYNLGLLGPGDHFALIDSMGRRIEYDVVARAVISKQDFADRSGELFATDGPARVRLISCGGYYDRDLGGYQANVVITARTAS